MKWQEVPGRQCFYQLLRCLLSSGDKSVTSHHCADTGWYFSLQYENSRPLHWVESHSSLMCSIPRRAREVNASRMTFPSWWSPPQKRCSSATVLGAVISKSHVLSGVSKLSSICFSWIQSNSGLISPSTAASEKSVPQNVMTIDLRK